MKLVYTHENIVLAQNARSLLENSGIKTVLKNEFASGGAGDLVPSEIWAEVYVLDHADFSRAEELLRPLSDKMNQPDWTCQACQELNGAMFESCWNCQALPGA